MSVANKSFNVGIKGVVVDQITKKALVLVKTDQTGRDYYDLAGGCINAQETVIEALKRELAEEIVNLPPFTIGKLLSCYRLDRDLNDGQGLLLVFYKINCTFVESKVQITKEHKTPLWISQNELNNLTNNPNVYIDEGYLEAIKLALA